MTEKRIVAFLADYMIVCCFVALIGLLLIRKNPVYFVAILLLGDLYIIIRDCFNGQSIGKKLVKIKVVGVNGEEAKARQCIIRNLTIFIWPVEVMFLIVRGKTIGDIISKTITTYT